MNSEVIVASKQWQDICGIGELQEKVGVRALFGDKQIALFKVDNHVYAVDAIDPFSHAAVMARGIVGDVKGQLVVASPIFKQHFSLETGHCLEDDSVSLVAYQTRVRDDVVQVAAQINN